MKALVLMMLLVTSAANAASDVDSRRFVLIVIDVSDDGVLKLIQFQNNTFTTEASCKRAGDQLIQKLGRHNVGGVRARTQLVYQCLDRGSAV